jgi:hypothetical protein
MAVAATAQLGIHASQTGPAAPHPTDAAQRPIPIPMRVFLQGSQRLVLLRVVPAPDLL